MPLHQLRRHFNTLAYKRLCRWAGNRARKDHLPATLALRAIGASPINIARHGTNADIAALIPGFGMTVMLAEKGLSKSEYPSIEQPSERQSAPLIPPETIRTPSIFLQTTETRRFIALSEIAVVATSSVGS